MEFEHVFIENFCTIKKINLTLNTPGLILVCGENKDSPKYLSNGAGKSSILSAITWCIWGQTISGLVNDEVVNESVNKNCCVAVTIKDEDNTYVISRHRLDTRIDKPNDIIVTVNGNTLGSNNVRSTQETINRLIGFDFLTFCAMMPGTGIKPSKMTDKSIKELLEGLLQSEQFAEAHDLAKTRLKELELKRTKETSEATKLTTELDTNEKELAQLELLESDFEADKKKQIGFYTSRIDFINKEVAEYETKLAKETDLLTSIATQKQEMLRLEEQKSSLLGQYQRGPLREQLESLKTKIQEVKQRIWTQKSTETQLREKLDKIDSIDAVCPLCEQIVDTSHAWERSAPLCQGIEDSLKAQADLDAELTSLTTQNSLCEAQFFANLKDLSSQIDSSKAAIQVFEIRLEEVKVARVSKARVTIELEHYKKSLQEVESYTRNFEQLKTAKNTQIEELRARVTATTKQLEDITKEHALCDYWLKGFSPSGLRNFMLDRITPILNDRVAHYSQILTNNEMSIIFSTKSSLKSGEERDKFNIKVKQTHGSSSYTGNSVGERARADLVIALALGDLAQFRTAKQLEWRFLDEPFESIDEAGTEAIMQLLAQQQSKYKTVFVVTHQEAFKKLFNKRITLVKENGVTKLL